jgi:hypothetical protein
LALGVESRVRVLEDEAFRTLSAAFDFLGCRRNEEDGCAEEVVVEEGWRGAGGGLGASFLTEMVTVRMLGLWVNIVATWVCSLGTRRGVVVSLLSMFLGFGGDVESI